MCVRTSACQRDEPEPDDRLPGMGRVAALRGRGGPASRSLPPSMVASRPMGIGNWVVSKRAHCGAPSRFKSSGRFSIYVTVEVSLCTGVPGVLPEEAAALLIKCVAAPAKPHGAEGV